MFTEYFKHAAHSPFFPFQNAVCLIILPFLVRVLFTLYIQGVLKFKNKFGSLRVKLPFLWRVQIPRRPRRLHLKPSRLHLDTTYSVGLLLMTDRPFNPLAY
jgi:hypothetical protein